MNIGYIKLDKLNKLQQIYRNLFKIIIKNNDCYHIPVANQKIMQKLDKILRKENINYIIQEKDINFKYNQLSGKYIIKYMIPEVLEYCFKILNRESKLEEIHICVEKFTKENINIIEELCQRVKIVNIVTNNMIQFKQLEKRLERNDIYITVSSNKRKSLKRANIVVNIDFEDLKEYNLNRNSIVINSKERLELGKDFEGICIERGVVDTNKIMRVFSEMQTMNKHELIEAEIIKPNEYAETRQIVKNSKIRIIKLVGKRNIISLAEFKELERKQKNERTRTA